MFKKLKKEQVSFAMGLLGLITIIVSIFTKMTCIPGLCKLGPTAFLVALLLAIVGLIINRKSEQQQFKKINNILNGAIAIFVLFDLLGSIIDLLFR